MDFGIAFFSSLDIAGDQSYENVVGIARHADEHGYRAVWLPERHFHAFGGLFPNPSVVAAALARETRRISLRAGSVVAPLHDPVRIVEEWSAVDRLSGGRVELSFASGWNADDFVFFPDRYADRRLVTLESVAAVRALWSGAAATRVNGVGNVVELRVHPRPVQSELPVWLTSAGSPETFAAAGRMGCSVLTHVVDRDLEALAGRIAVYREAAPDGRVALMLHTYVGEDEAAVDEVAEQPLRAYLRSAMRLEQRAASHDGTGEFDEALLDELVERSYERHRSRTSLIGSVAVCVERVRLLERIGVDEIACLVDFGIAPGAVLAGLRCLDRLRDICAGTATHDHLPGRAPASRGSPPENIAVGEHDLKQVHRVAWGAGDYLRIADLMAPPCIELVRRLDVAAGMDVADVACGTGNVAIPAARLGARVVGIDLTPEHFPAARRRAAEAGVEVDWREGDAERLDLPDAAFDRVTSTFGAQFAPRHRRVADELVRVCRPGGVIGMCNWTERGWAGRFQRILASYFPPPQEYQAPAMQWGDERYVRDLFGRHPVTIECRLAGVPYRFPSAEHLVRFFEAHFGPLVIARRTVSPRTRWAALRAEIVDMTEAMNVLGPEEGLLVEAEYLEVIVRRHGTGAP